MATTTRLLSWSQLRRCSPIPSGWR